MCAGSLLKGAWSRHPGGLRRQDRSGGRGGGDLLPAYETVTRHGALGLGWEGLQGGPALYPLLRSFHALSD